MVNNSRKRNRNNIDNNNIDELNEKNINQQISSRKAAKMMKD